MHESTLGRDGELALEGRSGIDQDGPIAGSSIAHGKSVTFGVRRGCMAVPSPVSLMTWLIAP